MTLNELSDLGEYIASKGNKETIFNSSLRKIKNEDFKYIELIGDTCCIRYKKDNRKSAIQYKTLNGAKKYVDKVLGGSDENE